MNLCELHCPNCFSEDIKPDYKYNTINHGLRTMFLCKTCGLSFSETNFFLGFKEAYQFDLAGPKCPNSRNGTQCRFL